MGEEPSRDVILKPYSNVRLRSLTLRGVEGHPSRGVRSGGSSRVVVRYGSGFVETMVDAALDRGSNFWKKQIEFEGQSKNHRGLYQSKLRKHKCQPQKKVQEE